MTETEKSLVRRIVDCGVNGWQGKIEKCRGLAKKLCPSCGDFHLPDPWNGRLASARLLIVGINPGFDPDEYYPSYGSPAWMNQSNPKELNYEKIFDFFENRFWAGRGKPSEKYRVCNDGHSFLIPRHDLAQPPVSYGGYWNYAKEIAEFILERNGLKKEGDIQPKIGVDYVLTELVHCKTEHVGQVPCSCYRHCFENYFNDVLQGAKKLETIVIVGSMAREICAQYWRDYICLDNMRLSRGEVKKHKYERLKLKLENRELVLYFADHNNGRGVYKGTIARFHKAAK